MLLANRQFQLLCASTFFFFASFNMIIPELPAFLSKLGGESFQGLIIFLFTLMAGISRPFSGRLADTIGRKKVMAIGAIAAFLSSLLYPFLQSILWFFILRFFHGLATGFQPTGNSAMTADIVPNLQRGEAMGYIGFFSTLGTALGPFFGSTIVMHFDLNHCFYASAFAALISVLILFLMDETLDISRPFSFSLFQIPISEFFEKSVYVPAAIFMFYSASFGIFLTYIPEYTRHLGFENKGLFFLVFTMATMFIRLFAAKLSDRKGRVPVLRAAMPLLFISFIIMAFIPNKIGFYLSSILYGISAGFISPTLFAWTVDRADFHRRGAAMSSLYIAMEIGIGYGALISGFMNNFFYHRYDLIFSLCILATILSWALCYLPDTKHKRVWVDIYN